jgi:3-hydroxyisobutyrate dehydrogenase
VEQVHLGARGTLAARRPPKLIIDMTTSRPSLAVAIHEQAAQRGVGSLDAPVSGGDVGAREATLSIMVGGGPPHIEQAMPVLQIMGRNIVHQGGPGTGQHAKMVNQILIAANMVGVCEGLLYAQAAGLDPETVLRSVSAGAAGSWSVSNLAPRIIRGDFEPGFYIEHFIKDLGIALKEAQRMKLNLPGLVLAKQLYEQAQAQGLSRKGTQALMLVYDQMTDTARATAGPRRGPG